MTYRHLDANGAYQLQTGRGMLHSVVISHTGTGNETLHLYDGMDATGHLICHVDAHSTQITLLYDVQFEHGLHAILAGGGAPDVTVTYM